MVPWLFYLWREELWQMIGKLNLTENNSNFFHLKLGNLKCPKYMDWEISVRWLMRELQKELIKVYKLTDVTAQ